MRLSETGCLALQRPANIYKQTCNSNSIHAHQMHIRPGIHAYHARQTLTKKRNNRKTSNDSISEVKYQHLSTHRCMVMRIWRSMNCHSSTLSAMTRGVMVNIAGGWENTWASCHDPRGHP